MELDYQRKKFSLEASCTFLSTASLARWTAICALRFLTYCASIWISTAPKRAVIRARVARALYWLTANASSPALPFAVQYQGREITTIEGLAPEGQLHPLQQAFIAHDGFQCGYCTPGQICSAIGMAAEVRRGLPSHVTTDLSCTQITLGRDELCERMSGNLCRCGAYNGIVDAITEYVEAT